MSETIIKCDNPLPLINELVEDFHELKVAVNALESERDRLKSTLTHYESALKEAKRCIYFALSNNHRDNCGGRCSCLGHECPTCDKLNWTLATINKVLGCHPPIMTKE